MGAGGSTQVGAKPQPAPGATAPAARQAPSSLTAMKTAALSPLPTVFPTPEFNPQVHKVLASRGVGIVLNAEELRAQKGELPAPLSLAHVAAGGAATSETPYHWFAEDLERVGQWEPYNDESSQRLESAFLNRKESCLVTLRKRAYTVHLTTMQQLPEGMTELPTSSSSAGTASASGFARPRRVCRAPAKITKDPTTGATTVEMIRDSFTDPFNDDDEDAAVGARENDASNSNGAGVTIGASERQHYAAQAANTALPRFHKVTYPSTAPVYALDITPPVAELSEEARAAGMGENGDVYVLSGGKDGRLVEWNATNGAVKTRYAVTASKPTCVLVAHYSPSARLVVCGCDDNTARVYRAGSPSPAYMLRGHTHKIYAVNVLAGERRIITGSMDTHVRLWDVETGACTHDEQAHTSHIFVVLPSKYNESFCLSAGNDAIVCAHDLRCANSVVMRLKGHTNTLWDVGIFPGQGGENHQLASAGMDATVRLWDPRRPDEAFQVLRNHTKPVHSVAYLPHGKGILSSAKDSYIFLSDTNTGEALWRAKAQQTSVFRVLYHAERQTMFTSGVSGLVSQWEWPAGEAW